jgi:uncharacterized membrane protein YcaP (DUF421 family)
MLWWEMIWRSAAVFLALLIWARILGKKLISQMTFFDFVAGVAIGSIGAIVMFNQRLPFGILLLGLSAFCAMAFLSDMISLKSFIGRKVLDSEPTIVIRNGQILEKGMAKERLTMDALLMKLRKKNVFYVDEVELAYFEIDGTLSVLRKSQYLPATRGDVKSTKPSRGRPQSIVIDGKVLPNSLKEAGKDEEWLHKALHEAGIQDASELALAQVDELDNLYLDKKKDVLH